MIPRILLLWAMYILGEYYEEAETPKTAILAHLWDITLKFDTGIRVT